MKIILNKRLIYLNNIKYNNNKSEYILDKKLIFNSSNYVKLKKITKFLARYRFVKKKRIPISRIKLSPYDQCLSNYLFQRLKKCKKHIDTCWGKKCEFYIPLGVKKELYLKPSIIESLHENTKKNYFSRIIWKILINFNFKNKNFCYLKILPPARFQIIDIIIKIKEWIKRYNPHYNDRILEVYSSIKKYGWDKYLAEKPYRSVLFYHYKSKKFSIGTGRHRIAALIYAYKNQEVSKKLNIDVVVIRVPWSVEEYKKILPKFKECYLCRN